MLEPRIWNFILILLQILSASCLKKNSLTFVIDDTISMDPVIEEVRKASTKIMDIILKEKSSQIEDVVLVTFNDPATKFWTRSRNRNEIIEALYSIKPHTDRMNNYCPEYAMSGTYLGLNSSWPGSSLFVFTDSDAEDKRLDSSVIDLCQKTQSTVNFIITTSYCVTDPDTELAVYYKVAKACSGKVIYLEPKELSEIFKLVNVYVQGETTPLKSFNVEPFRFSTKKEFTIDEQVEYVLITSIGQTKTLRVYHKGQKSVVETIVWLEKTKAIRLNNPTPGKYLVEVFDHGHLTIEIVGRTDFTFEHGFSQQRPKSISDTTAQPIGDTNNYLSVLVSDPSKAVLIKSVEILNMKDDTIIETELDNLGEDFYTTKSFKSPNHTFKIVVHGIVKASGRNISRSAKIPVEPQPKPKVIPNKTPVVIISEGNNMDIKYGESVTLTCKVSAYPPPSIYWKDSSGKILSKTFALSLHPYDYVSYLTLNKIDKSKDISCHADNNLQSTKKTINIKVKYFEIHSKLPDITEAKYGTSTTIKCDIRSSARITIHWYYLHKSIQSLATSSSYKISADARELTIPFVDLNKAGNYICEATLVGNEAEKETLHTELKVVGLEVPVIQKVKPTVDVLVNNPITLHCKTNKGVPKPQITWQQRQKSKWVLLNYTGEDLHIPKVDISNSGVYKCVALNSLGSDQFDTEVIVNFAPAIKSDKTEYEVSVGVPYVKILCDATGYPKPVTTWFQREQKISTGGNYTVSDGALIIQNPQENEILHFTCGASNEHGHDLKEYSLKVNRAPSIDKNVKVIKAYVNTTVTINCKLLHGTPKPKVTWQWRPKSAATWLQLKEISDQFQLSTVSLTQAGDYKCMAENIVGKDHLETELIVQSAPIIVSNKTIYVAVVNDSFLRIDCKVVGYPKPRILWRKDKNYITPGKGYMLDEGDLVIERPQEMDAIFTCEAINEFGKDSKTFTVAVRNHLIDFGEKKYIYTKKDDKPTEDEKILKCPLPYKNSESVQWFSDGFNINVTGPIFKIENYTDSNYTCRVIDKHSLSAYTFVFYVGYAPEFLSNENNVIWTGSDEVINCEIRAKPRAKIEWYYNGEQIDDINQYVEERHIIGWGKYLCRASNVYGSVEKVTIVKSNGCLIKQRENTLNNPLALIRRTENDKSALTWLEYDMDKDYYNIKTDEKIIFSCPGDDSAPNHFKKFSSTNELQVTCDHQDNFVVNGSTVKYSDLICNRKVTASIVRTNEICHIDGIDKLKVGFKASEFIEVYEACYDNKRAKVHSVLPKKATWDVIPDISINKWYQYPGISKKDGIKLPYNCSTGINSCCYAKRQLLRAAVEPYSSSAVLSTYIENINSVPEWQACNARNNSWYNITTSVASLASAGDFEVIYGASYTSEYKVIPKYLWQLIVTKGELDSAIIYVNKPNPAKEDILCTEPCKSDEYLSLELKLTEDVTYCCTSSEFLKHFSPKLPHGYIN